MGMRTLIQRRSTGYYFRQAVPEELRAILGKKEIVRSLRTNDPREAKRLERIVGGEVEAQFDAARRQLQADTESAALEITDEEAKSLANIWLLEQLANDEKRRFDFRRLEWFEPLLMSVTLQEWKQANAKGNVSWVLASVAAFSERHGLNLKPGSPAYQSLSRAILKVAVEGSKTIENRNKGEVADTPPIPAIWQAVPRLTPHMVKSGTAGVTADSEVLTAVVAKWVAERGKDDRTASEWQSVARRFASLHGDMPVRMITKEQARTFKEALQRYPARIPLAFRSKPFGVVLEAFADDTERPKLSAASIRKALNALGSVMSWAVANGLADANPFSGFRIAGSKRSRKPGRLPYDTEDLTLIFSWPVFTNGERPTRAGGEAAYWLPTLALFTGARLEELGQLSPEDIKHTRGVDYIDISDIDPDKSLKTDSSRRHVPLHPELVRLGFLDYVEAMQAQRQAQLFPALKRGQYHELTDSFTRWWGYYARKNGLTEPRKTFHSFRHTFKARCRAAGIAEELHDKLTGHSSVSVGRQYGAGDETELALLAKEIAKIEFPGLELAGWRRK